MSRIALKFQILGNYLTGLTGDVTATGAGGPGSQSTTIASGVVSNSKLSTMVAHTFKGNNTGSTAAPLDLTATELTAELNAFTDTLKGLTPASGGGTSNFLRADGTWAAPSGGSGATIELDNLGVTAVNADIIPDGQVTWSLGTQSLSWANVAVQNLISPTGGALTITADSYLQMDSLFVNLPQGASDPSDGGLRAGAIYYNTGDGKIKMYNGATWETITSL
jgi:hypothetical protein